MYDNDDLINDFKEFVLSDDESVIEEENKTKKKNMNKKKSLMWYECTNCNKEWFSENSKVLKCLPCSKMGIEQIPELNMIVTLDLDEKGFRKYFRRYRIFDNNNEDCEVKQFRRLFGYYECSTCLRDWCSARSWIDCYQKCKYCLRKKYPDKVTNLKEKTDIEQEEEESFTPHQQDLCGKCKKLGRKCTAVE